MGEFIIMGGGVTRRGQNVEPIGPSGKKARVSRPVYIQCLTTSLLVDRDVMQVYNYIASYNEFNFN